MYPYQLSKVLADERIRDRVAAAERHWRIAAAMHSSTGDTEPSRFRDITARMMALFRGRQAAHPHPTMASGSSAGPMGCST